MTRFFALLAFSLLLCTAPSRAAEINAEGAAHLKGMFMKMLDYQKNVSAAGSRGKVTYEGEVSVEPSGDYYSVTLPQVSIIRADGTRTEVGMISINASPDAEAGQWKMSIALPTPMILYDAQGNITKQTHFGSQRAAGLWREDIESFTKLEARYQNVTIEDKEGGYNALIPQAAFLYNLTKNADNTWSGPLDVELTNIQADFAETATALTIGTARARFEIRSFNPAAAQEYKSKLLTLLETGQGVTETPSAAHSIGIYNMLFDFITKAADGFGAQYEISNVNFTKPAANGEKENFNGHIDNLKAGMDITGILQNRMNISLRLGMSGTQVSKSDSLMPKDLNIAFAFNNIPFKEIGELGKNTLQASIQQPESAKLAGIMLLTKIPAILSQSGATLTIPDNYISNESYRIHLDGNALADMTAVNSVTAKARLDIAGLDWLISTLEADITPEKAERSKDLAAKLKTFKGMARPETAPDGKPLHVLDIEMDKAGKMLLNGVDASAKAVEAPADGTTSTPPPAEDTAQ